MLSLEEAPIGENAICFECDSCGLRAPCREPDRPDLWLPARWLETVPSSWPEGARVDEDCSLHWCPRCAASGAWEGQPPDLAALPETAAP